jgi:hypothetical protein
MLMTKAAFDTLMDEQNQEDDNIALILALAS